MSVRYGIYGDQQPADGLRDLSARKGSMWLYENKFTLPVAFMLPSDVEGNWILIPGIRPMSRTISAMCWIQSMYCFPTKV